MTIPLTSSAFAEGGFIPAKHTCDGEDVSPPLTWNNVPAHAKSLALISDDPDAPMGTWVHWVLHVGPIVRRRSAIYRRNCCPGFGPPVFVIMRWNLPIFFIISCIW